MSRLPAEPRDQWTPIHERVSEKLGGHFKTRLTGYCFRIARHSDAMRAGWVQGNPYDVIMSLCQRRMTLFSMHASKQSSLARLPMVT